MKIEDIVNSFNLHIIDRRKVFNIDTTGHIVLQKSIKPCESFKAYKECEYIIWFVKLKKKYKVLSVKKTIKLLASDGETALNELDLEISKALFNIIGSTTYDNIINGDYKEGCE